MRGVRKPPTFPHDHLPGYSHVHVHRDVGITASRVYPKWQPQKEYNVSILGNQPARAHGRHELPKEDP